MISIPYTKMVLRNNCLHHSSSGDLDEMGRHFELGDWKLLYILSRNMEPLVFGEFLRELYQAIQDARKNVSSSQKELKKEKQKLMP